MNHKGKKISISKRLAEFRLEKKAVSKKKDTQSYWLKRYAKYQARKFHVQSEYPIEAWDEGFEEHMKELEEERNKKAQMEFEFL